MASLDLHDNGNILRTFELSDLRPLIVGRKPSLDIRLDDERVSSLHCKIIPRRGQFFVIDLGSANGTFVDGCRIREAFLKDGSLLRVGRTELLFRAGNDASPRQTALPVLNGYRIYKCLSVGEFGAVFHARQISLDRNVALKILEPEALRTYDSVQQFMQLAARAASLNHGNIVKLYDVFATDAGQPVLCMEYLEGQSLRKLLARERLLAPARAGEILRDCLRGLAYAHENGLAHADLNPTSILLDEHGCAKLNGLAVGVSIFAPDRESTLAQAYIAPECRGGSAQPGIAANLYSLGAVAHHMLTGAAPGEKLKPLLLSAPKLPEPLSRFVDSLLLPVRARGERSLTEAVSELTTILRALRGGDTTRQLPAQRKKKILKKVRKKKKA